jgi:capsular exopolysaccharide synthesis family protein
MAHAGQRVIVVDSDLRRPLLHRVFDLSNETGLTSLLAGGERSATRWVQYAGIENLGMITSGPLPPNPSELLGSQRMQALIARLQEKADVLIFDSPPVLAVTDAAVLARQVDGTLLVVDSGRTRRRVAEEAYAALGQVGASVLGVVLNKVKASKADYYYYYYAEHASDDGRGRGWRRARRRTRPVEEGET